MSRAGICVNGGPVGDTGFAARMDNVSGGDAGLAGVARSTGLGKNGRGRETTFVSATGGISRTIGVGSRFSRASSSRAERTVLMATNATANMTAVADNATAPLDHDAESV